MKVGLLYMMFGVPEVDVPGMYREVLSQIELADALGYDSIWLAEHHLARDAEFCGRLPAPLAFAATAAARTRRIRIGTAVKVLPLDNPIFVAEEAGVVDILSNGRLNLGVGQGTPPDLEVFRVPTQDKAERFREMVDVMLTAWRGGSFDFRGSYFSYENVALCPTPLQDPRRMLWIASRDEGTIRWAARNGLQLLIGQAEVTTRQAVFSRQYLDELETTGSAVQPAICGTRLCYVAETTDRARREIADAVRTYYARFSKSAYYTGMIRDGYIRDDGNLTFEQALDNLGYIAGDPEYVAAELQRTIDGLSLSQINCMVHVAGLGHDQIARSLELFAAEVMPKLRPAREPVMAPV